MLAGQQALPIKKNQNYTNNCNPVDNYIVTIVSFC